MSGLMERAVTRLLMRPAWVSAVDAPMPRFRLIELQGEALKDCAWRPGHKIQIKLDGGLATRTYTPIRWNETSGTALILAYIPGHGPGSAWVRSAESGDERHLLGPRRSMELDDLVDACVLFGDETSFGLAAAAQDSLGDIRTIHHVFEVESRAEALTVLAAVGIHHPILVERRPDDAHLPEVEAAVLRLADPAMQFMLSGNARSIQRLGRALKARGVEPQRIRAKAYWAAGKTGMD